MGAKMRSVHFPLGWQKLPTPMRTPVFSFFPKAKRWPMTGYHQQRNESASLGREYRTIRPTLAS